MRAAIRLVAGRAPGFARSSRGFTLPEALVSLLLVGVALVPLVRAAAADLRAARDVGPALEAVALAEARMRELTFLPADSVDDYLAPREGAFPAPFDDVRWRAALRPLDATPNLLQAAVRVEWEGRSFDLETVMRRPEPLRDGGGGR